MKTSDLIGFMVIEKRPGQSPNGLGFQLFTVAPRVGEFITKDEGGQGQAYRVIAVFHPIEAVQGSAGDLIVEHAGTDLAVRMGL